MRRGKSYFLHNIMLRIILFALLIVSASACMQNPKVNQAPVADQQSEIPNFEDFGCHLTGDTTLNIPVFYQGKWRKMLVGARFEDDEAWIKTPKGDSLAFTAHVFKCLPDSITIDENVFINYADNMGGCLFPVEQLRVYKK